jgi:hypothetical protein
MSVPGDRQEPAKKAAASQSANFNLLRLSNIVAYVVTVAVNSLAGAVGLNGISTGAVSDLYPTLIAPAGITFSIWGVIYIILLLFTIYQALPSNRDAAFQRKVSYLFVLSCAVNVVWLFLWHYGQIVLSVVLMFLLLASLISIYLRLGIGKAEVPSRERWFVHLPFSVYLGWITVASIANVAAALVSQGYDGLFLGEITWTVLVIVVALIITLLVITTRKDIGYSAVIVWALLGIIIKQTGVQAIVTAAGASIVIIVVALAAVRLMSGRS